MGDCRCVKVWVFFCKTSYVTVLKSCECILEAGIIARKKTSGKWIFSFFFF